MKPGKSHVRSQYDRVRKQGSYDNIKVIETIYIWYEILEMEKSLGII